MSSIYQRQINQINAQTAAQVTQLEQEGQAAYNDEMQKSAQASQQAQQAQQQSNAATQKANAEAQAANAEYTLMQGAGSAGNLYQKDLTTAETSMGYSASNMVNAQALSAQIKGNLENEQLEMSGAGRRGLSERGVENVSQQMQNNANTELTKVGNQISTLEGEYSAAQTAANKESSSEYAQEENSYVADVDAYRDYQQQAAAWASEADQLRQQSASYASQATQNLDYFQQAAQEVQQAALEITRQIQNEASAAAQQAAAARARAQAASNRAQTALVNQENAYNQAIMDSRNTAQILNIASSGSGRQLYSFLKTIYTGGNTQAAETSFTSFLGGLSQNQRSSVWNKLTGFRANLFGGDMNFHPFGM